MSTARETILHGPHSLSANQGVPQTDHLFANLCDYAKLHYKYSATKLAGSGGADLLATPSGVQKTVDCASLADAFVLLANEVLKSVAAKRIEVGTTATKFATKAHSQCFDSSVAGNIRTISGDYASVGRCVFATHHFVTVNGHYYDPCMLTTYPNDADVRDWVLQDASGPYYNKLYSIEKAPDQLLIRIPPPNDPKAHGFASGFLLVETKDLDKKIYSAAFKKEKPSWQLSTKSVNDFLKAAHYTPYQEKV